MSEPLLFVNPENGLVYEVVQAQEVNLQTIDEGHAFHKEQIASLELKRSKLLEINPDAVDVAEEAAEEPEQPQTDVVNPGATVHAGEIVDPGTPAPSATDASAAPVDAAVDAPSADKPEAPAQEAVATPPIAA